MIKFNNTSSGKQSHPVVEWWVKWCSENTSWSGNWIMVLEMVVHVPFNHLMLLLAQENFIDIVISSYDKIIGFIIIIDCTVEIYICIYIHSFMTGSKPLPKGALHIVRSRASCFKWEYPLLSLRPCSSFLRLLPHLPVTSIPHFIFPSITCCRRQFLCKMWPIQLAFRVLISCRVFLCSLTLSNTSSFLRWSVQLIFYRPSPAPHFKTFWVFLI